MASGAQYFDSVRVDLTPFFTAYLEICSLRRDLSDEFKGFVTNLRKYELTILLLHRTFAENSIAWHQQTLEYDLMRDYR